MNLAGDLSSIFHKLDRTEWDPEYRNADESKKRDMRFYSRESGNIKLAEKIQDLVVYLIYQSRSVHFDAAYSPEEGRIYLAYSRNIEDPSDLKDAIIDSESKVKHEYIHHLDHLGGEQMGTYIGKSRADADYFKTYFQDESEYNAWSIDLVTQAINKIAAAREQYKQWGITDEKGNQFDPMAELNFNDFLDYVKGGYDIKNPDGSIHTNFEDLDDDFKEKFMKRLLAKFKVLKANNFQKG